MSHRRSTHKMDTHEATDAQQGLTKVPAKKFWLVTINNPTDAEREKVETIKADTEYWCIGEELAPTTGMKHIHIALKLKVNQRASWFKNRIPGANLKFTTAGLFKNFIKYVQKGGNFSESGARPLGAGEAGSAAREENLLAYRESARQGKFEDIPEGEYRRYYKYYQDIRSNHIKTEAASQFGVYVADQWAERELKPWQKTIHGLLEKEPQPREIVWVYDSEGGGGKTSLGLYLQATFPDDVQVVVPGRSQDLAHVIIPGKKMYLFDIPRTQGEFVAWSFIEELKNGFFLKSKYQSEIVLMKPPHVVVMSNRRPPVSTETSGFSEDRILMISL